MWISQSLDVFRKRGLATCKVWFCESLHGDTQPNVHEVTLGSTQQGLVFHVVLFSSRHSVGRSLQAYEWGCLLGWPTRPHTEIWL